MKRAVLDDIARDYRLDQAAIGVALELTGDRPDAAAWRAFAIRLANATARYGEFRFDPASGEAVLVALRDANLNPL